MFPSLVFGKQGSLLWDPNPLFPLRSIISHHITTIHCRVSFQPVIFPIYTSVLPMILEIYTQFHFCEVLSAHNLLLIQYMHVVIYVVYYPGPKSRADRSLFFPRNHGRSNFCKCSPFFSTSFPVFS